MSRIRRNPMPTSGALFVTNPRRKNRMATRRRNRSLSRRRNVGLARRRRNTARRRNTSLRSRATRRNSAMLTMVMRQGKMSRSQAKALKRTNYKKFRALFEQAGGEKARIKHRDSRADRWTATKAKWAEEKSTRKSKSKSKAKSSRKSAASKRRKGKRKLSRWDKFQSANKGKGWSSSKMSEMYQKKYGATNPRRRKNSRKKAYRKNTRRSYAGLVLKKNGRKAYRKNTRRKNSRRSAFKRNGLVLRKNSSTGIMPIDAATKAVDSVPVVGGWVGPYVAPMAIGALSGGASFYLMRELGPKLPAKVQPFGYSLGGVLGGTLVAALPFGKVGARRLVAAGMVTVGAAIDLYRHLMAKSAEDAESATGAEASADEALSGFGAWEYRPNRGRYAGIALRENRGRGYGAWEYTGQGNLNGLELIENRGGGYGAWEYTGQGQLNGYGAYELLEYGDYSDASPGDAHYAPRYFNQRERYALRMGPRMWRHYFGQSPKQQRRVRSHFSRHASREGHRWAWLFKLVGPKKAKAIAELPPAQGAQVIAGLKAQAHQALPGLMEQAQSTESAPEAFVEDPTAGISGDIATATNGISGAEGVDGVGGFGSLLFTGNPY